MAISFSFNFVRIEGISINTEKYLSPDFKYNCFSRKVIMEEEKFSISDTIQAGKDYVDTQIKLLRLKGLSKGSRIFGSMALDIVKLVFTLFIIFFCSLALGFYLGELLDSNALGFLLTGVIFFILVLLIRSFEPKLESFLVNVTIRKVTSKWDDDDEEEEKEVEIDDATKQNVNDGFEENK